MSAVFGKNEYMNLSLIKSKTFIASLYNILIYKPIFFTNKNDSQISIEFSIIDLSTLLFLEPESEINLLFSIISHELIQKYFN